jgi:hypothetical protein
MIEGEARDEGTLTCSLVVKGAESPRLMHDPEAVPPMQRVDFSRVQEPTYCELKRREQANALIELVPWIYFFSKLP